MCLCFCVYVYFWKSTSSLPFPYYLNQRQNTETAYYPPKNHSPVLCKFFKEASNYHVSLWLCQCRIYFWVLWEEEREFWGQSGGVPAGGAVRAEHKTYSTSSLDARSIHSASSASKICYSWIRQSTDDTLQYTIIWLSTTTILNYFYLHINAYTYWSY